jgi:IS30 family transposase/transposase-like protein
MQFFLLVDRGSSVRAAARSLGISPDLAYKWRSNTGIAAKRSPNRVYSAEEKAEFFRRLELNRNVTAVAREMGFVRVTCFKWVHEAGIYISRDSEARKHAFFALREQGVSRAQAARELGINARQSLDCDQGVRQIPHGRIYPDGRIVRYTKKSQGNMSATTGAHLSSPVKVSDLERTISSRYLNLAQREFIHDRRAAGASLRQIAGELGRSPSTISREISRNSTANIGYLPYSAQRIATARRPRPKQRKLLSEGPLRDYVAERLSKRWSPEQISKRMRKGFSNDETLRVATETIYQAIYVNARGSLKREMVSSLRRGGVERRPRKSSSHRTSRFISAMAPLSERHPDIELRVIPGHWEGDLIVGAKNQSAVATMVERASRFTLLAHLEGDHHAATVRQSLVREVQKLPEQLRQTLTWDQGAEMAEHAAFANATDMKVYFCDPASPWQRGTNENTNGLLRQYFPKGTDLSRFSSEHVAMVADELNSRPRKVLDWETPVERLRSLIGSET